MSDLRTLATDTSTLRELVRDVLAMSFDDHSLIAWVASELRRQLPQLNDDDLRVLTATITQALLEAGLVEVGVPAGRQFVAENTSPDQVARRIKDRWSLPPHNANEVLNSLWISATDLGEAAADGRAGADAVEQASASVARLLESARYEAD
ncbi:MAG: hypothetical protein QOE72_2220 [Chloroflexota bacterium]|nr:hypothetical protein [Chloroflexota bacterium]